MVTSGGNNGEENFEAQQVKENIAAGEEKAPSVDVEADYERAQQFAVSDVDRTQEGEKAAEAATHSQLEVPQAEEPKHESVGSSDPEDFKELAKEVNPRVE